MTFMSNAALRWYHLQDIQCLWLMGTLVKVVCMENSAGTHLLNYALVASHNHVRNSIGLFDVGHMVQSKLVSSIFYLFILITPRPTASGAKRRQNSLNGSHRRHCRPSSRTLPLSRSF